MREVPVHYLSENKSARSPHRVLFLDTESDWVEQDGVQYHSLRLWCARLILRHGRGGKRPAESDFEGATGAGLADLLEGLCRKQDALWVYAHNLSFDLSVSGLAEELARRGWELYAHTLASEAPWLRFRRDGRHLYLADSFSLLPTSIEQIGLLVGLGKPELPPQAAGDEDWRRRCRADVAILAAAMTRLLDWWDREEKGVWAISGPSCAWNYMRHTIPSKAVVIDPDPDARALERRAIYGGRRDLWRFGALEGGPFADLDCELTHGTICAEALLPQSRRRAFESLPLDYYDLDSVMRGLLAEVEVETDRPRYPLRLPHGVVYPVGRFATVLAGPEIQDAHRRGLLRRIGRGYKYRLDNYLRPWALRLVAEASAEGEGLGEVERLCAKQWTRTITGRFASLTSRSIPAGRSFGDRWQIEYGSIGPPLVPAVVLSRPPLREYIVRDEESENSFPAVLAWIQSYLRVRLNALIDLLGDECLVACNTDGVLVDLGRAWWWHGCAHGQPRRQDAVREACEMLRHVAEEPLAPLRPRVKGIYRRVVAWGPQHLELDRERRLSGVPRGAKAVGADTYEYLDWPKLREELAQSGPGVYLRRQRRISVSQVRPPRWVCADGACLAPRVRIGEDGRAQVLVGLASEEARDHGGLIVLQNAALPRVEEQ